jgi:hypothetical protein
MNIEHTNYHTWISELDRLIEKHLLPIPYSDEVTEGYYDMFLENLSPQDAIEELKDTCDIYRNYY